MINNIKDNFKENNKIIYLMIVVILTLVVAIIGTTYAYFSANATDTNNIYGSSAYDANTLSVEVTQVSSGNGNLIPQLDSAIQNAVTGATGKGSCIDANDNTICKVYSIKITNNANVALNVTGKLTLTANDMTNLKWSKGTSATSGFSCSSNSCYGISTTSLADASLTSSADTTGNSKTYYVVIWISETNSSQTDKNNFTGVVTFDGYVTGGDGTKVNGITSTIRG